MRLFSYSAATHFCAAPPPPSAPEEGLISITQRYSGKRVTEGTAEFEALRQNMLREVERLYFFALATFRRAHTLFVPSAAPWCHVTLYYSNWFAAHAVLGMFGGWAGLYHSVEVGIDLPGKQVLRIAKQRSGGGSHKSFWRTYYDAVRPLKPSLDPAFATAVDPISANPTWQIENRNSVNYNLAEAERSRGSLAGAFSATLFPASLSGAIATQYELTRTALALVAFLLNDLNVSTDVYTDREQTLGTDVWDIQVADVALASDRAQLVV